MTTTSQPKDYSTISTSSGDTITITGLDTITSGLDNITIISSDTMNSIVSDYSTYNGDTITYSSDFKYSPSTVTINNTEHPYVFNFDQEWKNSFPNFSKIENMCEQYPGLKIAFENFKVFYEMVKDDYNNPTPKK